MMDLHLEKFRIPKKDLVMLLAMTAVSVLLYLTGMLPAASPEPGTKERAVVTAVDNSQLETFGLLQKGSQLLEIRMLSGRHKGKSFRAVNEVRAQMELDKVFAIGDTILAAVPHDAVPGRSTVNAQDHYRISYTILLFALFAALLLIFGGWVGLNALLSFIFCCMVVWKVVLPLCLMGWNAMAVSFGAVALMSAAIIFMVAGLNRKGCTAFAGTVAGVLASSLMAWLFAGLFRINGASMPYSQALLYSGYEFLKLSDIFIGAVFLSSSGAVMDLAMDIAVGMKEVQEKHPAITRRELIASGFRMGRSVVGTMTTTLLLAYSGGYMTLLMTFAAQGMSPVDFINNPQVAAEMVKTLVGSFGLVLVAPLTALAGGWFYFPRNKK